MMMMVMRKERPFLGETSGEASKSLKKWINSYQKHPTESTAYSCVETKKRMVEESEEPAVHGIQENKYRDILACVQHCAGVVSLLHCLLEEKGYRRYTD
jgi:hypothetical protein